MKIVMVTMTKEDTLVVLIETQESVDDASNVTDQVIRKFATHAIMYNSFVCVDYSKNAVREVCKIKETLHSKL